MGRPDYAPRAPLCLLFDDPEAALRRLREGDIDALEGAHDQLTDLHLLYALKSGLLAHCAAGFPDPRLAPEIPVLVLLAASVAGAFQGEYALCQTGCALHSPALLAELGLNVQWLRAGAGLSRRGTQAGTPFHPDTLRKLLQQLAREDQAAGHTPGTSLLTWWNQTVGPAFLQHADGGLGVWLLDATKLLVNLKNPRYEGSSTGKDTDGKPIRGYKLGLLSTLIGEGRLLIRIGWDAVRAGDATVAWPLVQRDPPLGRGDTLLHDRGLIHGETVTCLKQDLGIEVVFPLPRSYLAYRLAVSQARRHPQRWQPHPTRQRQEIQGVAQVEAPWEACQTPLRGCVVRQHDPEHRDAAEDGYCYWVFVSTQAGHTAKQIIQTYETRSECEEDHRQTKGANWEMDEFTSTSLVEIIYHVLMVLFAYNLCQLYGLTEAGQRFAGQTKRARARELRRDRRRWMVVVAAPYYAVLPEWQVLEVLLEAEGEAKERLRAVVARVKGWATAGRERVG